MDAATASRPAPTRRPPLSVASAARGVGTALARRVGPALDPHRVALGVVLAATLGLRLWGIKQGLPYSYNSDEASHFVPRAIAFFSHDLNPHYFLNPPGYSYLVQISLELWFGSADAVRRIYATDPTAVLVLARVVAALLGTLAVWLTYLAGARMFDRTVGLLAAAAFGCAFMPVFYSHLALNDTPALAPVALALYGVAGILRPGPRPHRRDYVIAGVGIGLAAAIKYTGGITVVCLLAAAACDCAGGAPGVALRRTALAVGCALAAFVAANPFSVLDFPAFHAGITTQQALAGGSDPEKLGTTASSGTAFYFWTLTWGLGWVPSLAALGGSALLVARRRIARALVLIPAPIAFIVFMGDQQRYFGRWLLPVYEIVALLGAYGAVSLARWLIARRGLPRPAIVGVTAIVMLAQGTTTVLHNDTVLSRADTRNLARSWMVGHIPVGAKVVVEPIISDNWSQDIGRSLTGTTSGARWQLWNTNVTDVAAGGQHLPPGEHRYVPIDQYERTLRPELINEYVAGGWCWVAIGSLQAGRSFAQPRLAPAAIAYYAQLANHARLMYHISPFVHGVRAVPFSFDWSIDYYPGQYYRPGPEISIYQLTGGRCSASSYAPKRT